jgi:hypothetical protein
MLTNLNDLVDLQPQTIQNFVRQLEYPQFELGEFFPDLPVNDNIFRFDKTIIAQEPALQYRAWDTEAEIGDRQGVARGTAELPPLAKKKLMTEEQRLRQRAIERSDWSAYIDQIYNDLDNLVAGTQARWEIDRGALLSTGQLNVVGEGGWTVNVNYGVPGGNIVTAGTYWSDIANADIIANLKTWVAAYKLANRGLAPGLILIGETVMGYMLRNNALRASMYFGAPNSGPSVLRVQDLQEEFRANGLPPFRVINSQATNASGTTDYVLPQNKIIMLPPQGINIGYTAKGVTGSALDLVQAGTIKLNEAPGIVGLTWAQNDPAQRWNMVDACGMPVLANPSLLFIAQVAA